MVETLTTDGSHSRFYSKVGETVAGIRKAAGEVVLTQLPGVDP